MRLQRFCRVAVTLSVVLLAGATGLAAGRPGLSIMSPGDGVVILGHNVPLAVDIRGFRIDCALAGKANQDGVGHWHVLLDDVLVDMACGPGYLVSLRNVKPGTHTLTAVLAMNNHVELKDTAARVPFTYQPDDVLPSLAGLNAGTPRLSIRFPKNGSTVSGQTFPLVLNVENFRLSCELLGKPPLANTGHWHVDLRKSSKNMATMMFMGCTNTFEVPLKGLAPGPHTFIVVLVDNLHYPISPLVTARVTVRVR